MQYLPDRGQGKLLLTLFSVLMASLAYTMVWHGLARLGEDYPR